MNPNESNTGRMDIAHLVFFWKAIVQLLLFFLSILGS